MKKNRSKVITVILVILILVFGAAAYYVYFALPIGTGFTAKYLCSSIFITGRGEEETFKEDIRPGNFLFGLITSSVDYDEQTVTSKGLGLFHEKTAIYREGLGSTLLIDGDVDREVTGLLPRFSNSPNEPWPRGDYADTAEIPRSVDKNKLEEAIDFAFTEPAGGGLQTRAVAVVYDGSLIAERYAAEVDQMTPLPGWSMAKTVTGLLTGMMVKDGLLDLDQPAPVDLWKEENDPRSEITLNHLLQMTTGLEFEEVYGPFADATNMLYDSRSMADYAADKPLIHKPGEYFCYSSGTTNILMRILMEAAGGELQDIYNYIMERLYKPLGMSTAVLEPDASGCPVGSSYMYASARDWARVGLFMLNDGVVDGRPLLPEGWIEYMTTPTDVSRGTYGAQTWLNPGDAEKLLPEDRIFNKLPSSMYSLSGFNHQNVFVFPEEDLVIVRLGVTHDGDLWDKETFARMVLESIN